MGLFSGKRRSSLYMGSSSAVWCVYHSQFLVCCKIRSTAGRSLRCHTHSTSQSCWSSRSSPCESRRVRSMFPHKRQLHLVLTSTQTRRLASPRRHLLDSCQHSQSFLHVSQSWCLLTDLHRVAWRTVRVSYILRLERQKLGAPSKVYLIQQPAPVAVCAVSESVRDSCSHLSPLFGHP